MNRLIKTTTWIGFLLLMLSFNACTTKSSKDEWKNIRLGLWESNTGELAIKTLERISDTDPKYRDKFIKVLGVAGDGSDPALKDVIDKMTFHQIGDQLYKDKNRVYYHRMHSDGGFLYETSADAETFRVIGACFAKDKDHIYYVSGSLGMGTMDVDYDSFKTGFRCGCSAVDKNNDYHFGEKVDVGQLSQEMRKDYDELHAKAPKSN